MDSSRTVPVRRTAPRMRQSRISSGSIGVDSSVASAAPVPPPAPAERRPFSLDEIMSSPARRLKPRLHPNRPEKPKDVWFSLDDCVRIDISTIYQNDFKGPWSCLSNVPREHQMQWWSKFAQRYYWEDEHHDLVVKLYRKQLKDLLKNLISKGKRDGVKPTFVSADDWNRLQERWDTTPAIKKSKDCSVARKSQRSGYGQHAHTGGSKPFTKIEYEMTEENNGVVPSIPELIKRTHTKSDGTYVDKKAEKIVEEVYNLATRHDQDSDDDAEEVSTPITPNLLNKTFFEHVPIVKGYRFGIGSLQYNHGQSSKAYVPCPPRQNQMEVEFGEMKETVSSLDTKVSTLSGKFDTLQASLNILVQTLTTGAAAPPPQQQQQPIHHSQQQQHVQPSQQQQPVHPSQPLHPPVTSQPRRELDFSLDDFNLST